MNDMIHRHEYRTAEVSQRGTNVKAVVCSGIGKYAQTFQMLNIALCAASCAVGRRIAAPCTTK